MDYRLCKRVLDAHYTDDVKTLIQSYANECTTKESLMRILEEKEQQIKILEAENRILKETQTQ